MKRIFKFMMILVVGLGFIACAPVSEGPGYVEPETPTEKTYSITFIGQKIADSSCAKFLNDLPDYKNLKEGTEVEFPTIFYISEENKYALDLTEFDLTKVAVWKGTIHYEDNITSVKVGNEDIEIKFEKKINIYNIQP